MKGTKQSWACRTAIWICIWCMVAGGASWAGAAETVLTFFPVADATIKAGSPTSNFGSATSLEADNSPVEQFLLKFTVAGTGSQQVLSAKLRLYNVNSSDRGGDFHRVADNGWSESTVTWNTAPPADPAIVASLGPVSAGGWYEVDLTSLIRGDGTYSLRVTSTSSDGADYAAKEAGATGPRLVVTTSALAANAGDDQYGSEGAIIRFTGSATGGTAPYSFGWDFGDKTTGAGQSVTHAYPDQGTYTVTLTATDFTGRKAADTAVVTIYGTSPSTLVVTAAGDLGATSNTTAVLDLIRSSGSQAHFALGDLSYGSRTPESAWCDYVKSRVGAAFPFEVTSGNHEDNEPAGNSINGFIQCLPDRLGGVVGQYGKQWYVDVAGLARVILISPALTIDGQSYSYTAESSRYSWVATAIDGARAAGLPWVIVGMHKVCVSVGSMSCEIGTDLLNLLVAKRVDLVLQGHDHDYQRSKQLALGAGCSGVSAGSVNAACIADDGADGQYTRGAGSIIAVVGTGGVGLANVNAGDSEAGYFARWMGSNVAGSFGVLRLTLSRTELAADFVPAVGSFTDRFVVR